MHSHTEARMKSNKSSARERRTDDRTLMLSPFSRKEGCAYRLAHLLTHLVRLCTACMFVILNLWRRHARTEASTHTGIWSPKPWVCNFLTALGLWPKQGDIFPQASFPDCESIMTWTKSPKTNVRIPNPSATLYQLDTLSLHRMCKACKYDW